MSVDKIFISNICLQETSKAITWSNVDPVLWCHMPYGDIKLHLKLAVVMACCQGWGQIHFFPKIQIQIHIFTQIQLQLECGTWDHHPRRLQCVLSRNLRIFKVATWHYRCRRNLKNNCIWDNLQYCLLVPRSPIKPVILTIDLQSRKLLFIEIVFGMYNLEIQLWYYHISIYWRDIALAICSRSQSPLNMNIERNFEATLWRHRWRHHHKKTFLA